MPGVSVTTRVRSGPTTVLQPASGQFFVVGQFERGAANAVTTVNSENDVRELLGNRVTYSDTYDQLITYFAEGGNQANVVRVVGDSPTIGTLSLSDRAGTPLPTLRVDAANPGAWSSNLTVEVTNGPSNDTFRITIRLNGDVVEDQNSIASPAEAVNRFKVSPFVRLTNLGSTSVAPANNPAVVTPVALTAGSDDRGTITTDTYVDGLDYLSPELGDGAVAVPGQTGSAIWGAIQAHCVANNRIGLLAAAKGETINNLKASTATLNSEYLGLFHPWVHVTTGINSVRVISPEGYVAGVRARAHELVGPWRPPAGAIAKSTYLIDTDQRYSAAEADQLDAAKVSVIRKQGNTPLLYGWRSLSNDSENWLYLKDRDLLNRISVEAQKRLEQFVFEPIDNKGQLLAVVNSEMVSLVEPIAAANGLYGRFDEEGDEIDPGYLVNTGASINTPATLAQNVVNVELAVRVSPTGALINLGITKVHLLGSL